MTTPEPMPGSVVAPFITETAQRMWERLPRVYRNTDFYNQWAFKRYLSGVATPLDDVMQIVDRLQGSRPIGPATPEPWDLDADDLERWRASRQNINSALTDPDLANPEWLPYLAQLVGAYLDPGASLAERRDIIRFATSGYRGGTKAALADAARSALTGSRYVVVQSFQAGQVAGTVWDVTLRTRSSETPISGADLIATVIRKGAKPAGVVLWYASFGTSWDKIEALYPTWTNWEDRTWDQMEEVGATYVVPENIAPNPSFEVNVNSWTGTAVGGTTPTWAFLSNGGIDGVNAGRLTKVNAAGGMSVITAALIDAVRILPSRDYIFAASGKPSVGIPVTMQIDWQNSGGSAISSTTVNVGTLTAGDWNRSLLTTRHTSPAGAARAVLRIIAPATVAAGVTLDLDAILFRLVTTGGG